VHVSNISEDFITRSRITHHYTFKYSTHTTTRLQNLRKHANIYSVVSPKHHAHRHTSLNIIPARYRLIPNIWYYSHTPRRLLTGSSASFGHSPLCFLSTPGTLSCISEHFYCATICTSTHSSIHPLWPFYLHCLKFSLDFRSIVKHTTSSPPFSEFNGTYSFLIGFFLFYFYLFSYFSHFLFILFVFYVSDLSSSFLSFIFLFSKYLRIFVHSCTCSITVLSK
jgi:hypothetical protein